MLLHGWLALLHRLPEYRLRAGLAVGNAAENSDCSAWNKFGNDFGPGLEALYYVGDQGMGEVAGETRYGGGAFVEEGGQIGSGLILLAEYVVVVLVKDVTIAVFEGDCNHYGDEKAGGLLGLGVVGERGDGLGEDSAVERCVGVGVLGWGNAEAGAGDEFANDRFGHLGFGAVGVSSCGENGNGQGPGARRKMRGPSDGVVAAGGQSEDEGGDGE